MDFYDRVKQLCRAKGVSMARMAKDIEISNGTVANWKAAKTMPQGPILRKLADYFNVSTDYLMTGEEPTYTAIRSSDEEVEIFEAINALKDTELRRLVLRLSKASQEEIRKVHGFLDLTQIGGSYGS